MFGYLIRRRKRLSAHIEEEEKKRIGRNYKTNTVVHLIVQGIQIYKSNK